jgi:N-acyl-D-amino-acid deacylase
MHDIVIKGASIVDGTGSARFSGDLAIKDGVIQEIGKVAGPGREVIDADGLIVAPGWVDVHTHYDGQVMWDSTMAPSVWHGVTTAILGNCGVGFAPVAADKRDYLIGLMEGVEDIPSSALAAALTWEWESFPEYLAAVDARPRTMDIGALLTHGALRLYAMGERAMDKSPAGPDDIKRMGELSEEAARAGALGFSTSRTMMHTALDGTPVPGTFASRDELTGIMSGMRKSGHGILEVVPAGIGGEDATAEDSELSMMEAVSLAAGCPVTFLLLQHNRDKQAYARILQRCTDAEGRGAKIYPQVAGRPITMLLSFQGENPFRNLPSYQPLLSLSHRERVAALRHPELRTRLLAEKDDRHVGRSLFYNRQTWEHVYPMGSPLNYFPKETDTIANIAKRQGVTSREVAYDLMLEQSGAAFLMYAIANWYERSDDALFRMLNDRLSVWGLGDGGAHVTGISDASIPTFMITEWVRDRASDNMHRFALEFAVKKMTSDNCALFGLGDRGTLKPGKRADLNVIDLSRLTLHDPKMVFDLPLDMPRLMQTASGYEATIVKGQVVQRRGELTGALPGRLVRA